jgi:hypothetical protein
MPQGRRQKRALGVETPMLQVAAPAWLRLRPHILVGWLRWRNAGHRWPKAVLAAVLAFIGLGILGRTAVAEQALLILAASPLAVFMVTAGVVTAIILRRRKRISIDRHRDWLAALPQSPSLTARAATAPLPIWVGVIFIIVELAIFGPLPLSALRTIIVATAGGYLAAVATVVFVCISAEPLRRRRSVQAIGLQHYKSPASHFAVVRHVRANWATNAGLAPLGYWPVGQTKFWNRPQLRARSLVLPLLAVPLGLAGAAVLAVASLWLLTLNLVNLLLGVVRVAFSASWWLAPTSIGAFQFMAAVSYRALGGQVGTCALLLGALYAVKGAQAVHAGLAAVAAWLVTVCLVSAIACAVARRTKSKAHSVVHEWMR